MSGLHAVVTGGGSGIGAAVAASLLKEGHHVTLMGRNLQRLQAQQLRLGDVAVQVCDVGEEARAELAKANPQGRLISPEEVAASVLWLTRPEAGGINGQAIAICGGETA